MSTVSSPVTDQNQSIGKVRETGTCFLLMIVTLGFYSLFWFYNVHSEMKQHSGAGLGGGLALVLAIFVGIAMPGTAGSSNRGHWPMGTPARLVLFRRFDRLVRQDQRRAKRILEVGGLKGRRAAEAWPVSPGPGLGVASPRVRLPSRCIGPTRFFRPDQ